MSLLLLFGGGGGAGDTATSSVDFDASGELSVAASISVATSVGFDASGELDLFARGRDGIGLNDPNVVLPTAVLYVNDLAGDQVYAIVNPYGLEQEWRYEVGEGLTQLRWALPYDDAAVGYVEQDATVTYDGIVYVVTAVEPERSGPAAWVHYEADALWVRLGNTKRVGDFVLTGRTPDEGLSSILDGTGWTAATVGSATEYGMTMTDASVLALLRQWAVVCGYEIEFDTTTKTVTFAATVGTTNGLPVRYGRNLRGIRKRTEPPKVTKLYAFGRNSLPLPAPGYVTDYTYYTGMGLSLAEAQADYTKVDVWTDTTIVDQDTLVARADDRLAILAQPKVTYEVQVADVSVLTSYTERYGIGDTVRVTDLDLGIDVQTRVARILRRPLDPARNEVELAASFDPADYSNGAESRGGLGDSWYHLQDDNTSVRTVTSGETLHTVIGVTFVEGVGIARHAVHFQGTAAGTGTLRVRLYDETNTTALRTVEHPFTDGEKISIPIVWAHEDLSGDYLFSVRANVSSGAGGVTTAVGSVHQNILVQGGLGVAVPPGETSITFDYTGVYEDWTVPPNVTHVNLDAYGAGPSGLGGRVLALRVPVTAGEVLRVYVGGDNSHAGDARIGGWPNGGDGYASSTAGGGGGGSSSVHRTPYTFTSPLVVAGGGGGYSWDPGGPPSFSPVVDVGGGGGYPTGEDGSGGTGGSQVAGGTAGGAAMSGGDGSGPALGLGGGGGGGGYYGGGGGGEGQSGGGGSSHESGTATAVLFETGTRSGDGVITISWTTS